MSKFCPHCGSQLAEGSSFCGNCGNSVDVNQPNVQTAPQANNSYTGGFAPTLTKRDVIVAVILSIVTCGIYGIYWFIVMTDDVNKVSNDNSTSGVMAFVLTLVTCGIYGIYWYYKMGKKLHQAGQMYGKDIADNSLIYILLGVLGFGIVNYCLIQADLNKFSVQ